MEIKSEQKHLIISPRKVRPIADVIKKLSVQKAIDSLPFIKKGGSDLLLKVVKSAVANAQQKGIGITELKFKEIQIALVQTKKNILKGSIAYKGMARGQARIVLDPYKVKEFNNERMIDALIKEFSARNT